MAYAPRIGLTMRLEIETRRFYLGRDYSEAVEAAGGIPVHIPLIPKRPYIAALMEELDGILLPGCDSDIDPAHFGEEPRPGLKRVVPEKDATDLMLLDEAERTDTPVFAICYGMQALAVSRGGTLIQDIASEVNGCLKHEQGMPLDRPSHSVVFENEGLIRRLAVGFDPYRVNSHHHQAVRDPGRDLSITSRASDGVIESVEDLRPQKFAVGVQWHPELNWRDDAVAAGLFASFVDAARLHGVERERRSEMTVIS